MAPHHRPLAASTLLLAHRGARAHATENTLESFRLALRLGATGIASDVWVTEDGVAVLDGDGVVGRVRKRPIRSVSCDDLPDHVPTVEDMYRAIGTAVVVALDVRDVEAVDPALDVARRFEATSQLWLRHPDHRTLGRWRSRHDDVRLVESTSVRQMDGGPERRAAVLRDAGVDAVDLHRAEWSAGLVTLFHRFGRFAWGRDAQHERMIVELMHMGIDGVSSDHVDRLVDAAMAVGID